MYDEKRYGQFILGLLRKKSNFNIWKWETQCDDISVQTTSPFTLDDNFFYGLWHKTFLGNKNIRGISVLGMPYPGIRFITDNCVELSAPEEGRNPLAELEETVEIG